MTAKGTVGAPTCCLWPDSEALDEGLLRRHIWPPSLPTHPDLNEFLEKYNYTCHELTWFALFFQDWHNFTWMTSMTAIPCNESWGHSKGTYLYQKLRLGLKSWLAQIRLKTAEELVEGLKSQNCWLVSPLETNKYQIWRAKLMLLSKEISGHKFLCYELITCCGHVPSIIYRGT
jgi:hypothetical protein